MRVKKSISNKSANALLHSANLMREELMLADAYLIDMAKHMSAKTSQKLLRLFSSIELEVDEVIAELESRGAK